MAFVETVDDGFINGHFIVQILKNNDGNYDLAYQYGSDIKWAVITQDMLAQLRSEAVFISVGDLGQSSTRSPSTGY